MDYIKDKQLANRANELHNKFRRDNMIKPKFYQCSKCGRFVKIIRGGAYMDDFGYWVQYKCKKHGIMED